MRERERGGGELIYFGSIHQHCTKCPNIYCLLSVHFVTAGIGSRLQSYCVNTKSSQSTRSLPCFDRIKAVGVINVFCVCFLSWIVFCRKCAMLPSGKAGGHSAVLLNFRPTLGVFYYLVIALWCGIRVHLGRISS